MNEQEYTDLLMKRGYIERFAKLVAGELVSIDARLQPLLDRWVKDPADQGDYAAEGYSLQAFVANDGMEYPAALLTMDWLLKEPEAAKASLKRGNR